MAFRSIEISLCVMMSLPAAVGPALAQSPAADDHWKFGIAPYLVAPYMSGELTVLGRDAAVEAEPGDIFSTLQIGAMLYAEARKGPWAIAGDALYVRLEQASEGDGAVVTAKQMAFELSGFRRIIDGVEVLLGGRLHLIDVGISFPAPDSTVSDNRTWADPIVGVRLRLPDSSRLILGLRADIGGFGLGSDLTWQLYPLVGYRFSGLLAVVVGYRVVDMKYSAGEGSELFAIDMTKFGPELGLVFHF